MPNSRNNTIFLDLTFTNKSQAPMTDFAIQFNVNTFGLLPNAPLSVGTVAAGQSSKTSVELNRKGTPSPMNPPSLIQIAIKNNVGVYYFATNISASVMG
jgi:Adaptin C-terminal domain